jgi:hypothetical protein
MQLNAIVAGFYERGPGGKLILAKEHAEGLRFFAEVGSGEDRKRKHNARAVQDEYAITCVKPTDGYGGV